MRALAEFVMRGRKEAVLTATLATGTVIFGWIGAAVVALVILRRGLSEGLSVLFWASLPAVVVLAWGDCGPLATLLGTALAAAALRATVAWPIALLTAVFSGVATGLVLLVFGQGYIDEFLRFVGDVVTEMQRQAEAGGQPTTTLPTKLQILGMLGLNNAMTVGFCLVLSRWWQAVLYNPGGFAQEFQNFRMTPALTLALLVAGGMLASLGQDYQFWALIFVVPFIFAGIGLIHGIAAKKQLSGNWLVLFYLCWILLYPLKIMVLLAVVIDSWIDIRGRLDKA